MKIVINTEESCLFPSKALLELYKYFTGKELDENNRHDPLLVKLVEVLGGDRSCEYGKLEVFDINTSKYAIVCKEVKNNDDDELSYYYEDVLTYEKIRWINSTDTAVADEKVYKNKPLTRKTSKKLDELKCCKYFTIPEEMDSVVCDIINETFS